MVIGGRAGGWKPCRLFRSIAKPLHGGDRLPFTRPMAEVQNYQAPEPTGVRRPCIKWETGSGRFSRPLEKRSRVPPVLSGLSRSKKSRLKTEVVDLVGKLREEDPCNPSCLRVFSAASLVKPAQQTSSTEHSAPAIQQDSQPASMASAANKEYEPSRVAFDRVAASTLWKANIRNLSG